MHCKRCVLVALMTSSLVMAGSLVQVDNFSNRLARLLTNVPDMRKNVQIDDVRFAGFSLSN